MVDIIVRQPSLDMTPDTILEMWRRQADEGVLPSEGNEDRILNVFAASGHVDAQGNPTALPEALLASIPRLPTKTIFPAHVERYVRSLQSARSLAKASDTIVEALARRLDVNAIQDVMDWHRVSASPRMLTLLNNVNDYAVPPNARSGLGPVIVVGTPIMVCVGRTPVLVVQFTASPAKTLTPLTFLPHNVRYLPKGKAQYASHPIQRHTEHAIVNVCSRILEEQGFLSIQEA